MVNLLGALLIIGVVYFLYKKGIISNLKFPIVKRNYTFNRQFKNKLDVSYQRFNGIEKYEFILGKAEKVTVHYDVIVEEGTLTLKWRNSNNIYFEKEFSADEQGSFAFNADSRACSAVLIGNHTKGGCHIKLQKEDGEEIQ